VRIISIVSSKILLEIIYTRAIFSVTFSTQIFTVTVAGVRKKTDDPLSAFLRSSRLQLCSAVVANQYQSISK